jgi:hypothetical protein
MWGRFIDGNSTLFYHQACIFQQAVLQHGLLKNAGYGL